MGGNDEDLVAIIIPTYGQFEYVSRAVETAAMTPRSMVIVVDDGSEDWPGERIVSGWMDGRRHAILTRKHDANLSRSWNQGYSVARANGAKYVVFGNSDLIFPKGWWPPMRESLAHYAFVGPVTNAPGHVHHQGVDRLGSYVLSDDPDDIQATHDRIRLEDLPAEDSLGLNGFCIAANVGAIEGMGDKVFSERIPLAGNETEMLRRARGLGLGIGIVRSAFVFHYRSVSRGLTGRRQESGSLRIPGCRGCGKKRMKKASSA